MTIITMFTGKSYTPEEVIQAIQKHIGTSGTLMGNITHVFRHCRRWQEERKAVPHVMKGPDMDYEEYAGGVVPDCAMAYFMEVVEPALRSQPKKQAAE